MSIRTKKGTTVNYTDKYNTPKKRYQSKPLFDLVDFYWERRDGFIYLIIKVSGDHRSVNLEVTQIDGETVQLDKVNDLLYRYVDTGDTGEYNSKTFKVTAESVGYFKELQTKVVLQVRTLWITSNLYPQEFVESCFTGVNSVVGRMLHADNLGLNHGTLELFKTGIVEVTGLLKIALLTLTAYPTPLYYIDSTGALRLTFSSEDQGKPFKIKDKDGTLLYEGQAVSPFTLALQGMDYLDFVTVSLNGEDTIVYDYKINPFIKITDLGSVVISNPSWSNLSFKIKDGATVVFENNISESGSSFFNEVIPAGSNIFTLEVFDENLNKIHESLVYRLKVKPNPKNNVTSSILGISGWMRDGLAKLTQVEEGPKSSITNVTGSLLHLLLLYTDVSDNSSISAIKEIIQDSRALSRVNNIFITGHTEEYDPEDSDGGWTYITIPGESVGDSEAEEEDGFTLVEEEEENPNLIIIPETTSALDFEKIYLDKIETTKWEVTGAGALTPSSLDGSFSFETKGLEHNLKTTSPLITGKGVPYTIRFDALISGQTGNNGALKYPLFSKNRDGGWGEQSFFVNDKREFTFLSAFELSNFTTHITKVLPHTKVNFNEINRYEITYDGSSLKGYVNKEPAFIIGTNVGLAKDTYNEPYTFLNCFLPAYPSLRTATFGKLDNVSIIDGLALDINEDPHKEFLVVDLPFDGENNSTKIVDNTAWELAPITPLFYPFTDSLYNGTVSGTIQLLDNSSPFNDKSAYFNNSYILHNSSSDFNLTNKDFTIKCWVKLDSNRGNANQYPSIIAKRPSGTQWDWGLECNTTNGGSISFVYNNAQYVTIKSGLEFDTWMHVCVTCKNNKLYLFFNGELLNSVNLASPISFSTANVLVGRTSTSWSDNYLKGNLSDLVFINGYCEHTETFTLPTEHLKNYNKWTVNGNAKISTDQKFDGFSSLYLNNGKITTSLVEPLGTFDFTINFDIIRMDDDNSNIFMWGRMLNIGNNSSKGGLYISRHSLSSNFLVDIYDNGYIRLFTTTDSPLSHNTKVNIKLIRSNGVFYLYINNILKFSNSQYTTYDISKSNVIIGGNDVNTEYLNGYIKNFKIYKGVAVIPENPTGKIQLDFDNNVVDKYGNSAWTNNGVTFDQVNSVKGYAAYFDSTSDYLETSSSDLNFLDKNFQIEFDSKSISRIIGGEFITGDTSSQSTNTNRFFIFDNDGGRGLGLYNTDTNYNPYTHLIYNNIWYNDLYVRLGNNIVSVRNGVVIDVRNLNFNLNINNSTFRIGMPKSSFGTNVGFNGYIDNFKTIKDYQEPVIIDRPAVHLPLETNSNNTGFTNLTINSVGSPTYTTVDGKKCIKFESGKYLTINSNNIFNLDTSSDFYIELDIYVISFLTYNVLLTNNNSWQTNSQSFWITSSGKAVIQSYSGLFKETSNSLSINTWTKIKLFRKGSNVSISINENVETFYIPDSINFSYNDLYIGCSGWARHYDRFNGYMSNFKMFVGTSEIPETYNDKKVLDLDFKPTRKSYLFKDNNNKCVIHPVNIEQRDYQDSQYCCSFNGTNQYLELGKNDLLNFGLDDFVISVKFKPVADGTWNVILANNSTSIGDDYCYIGVANSNHPTIRSKCSMVIGNNNISTTNEVSYDKLNQLIVIKHGDTYSLILNGIVTSKDMPNLSVNLNFNDNTRIGATNVNSDHGFKGYIHSVKILRNTSDITLLEESSDSESGNTEPFITSSLSFKRTIKEEVPNVQWEAVGNISTVYFPSTDFKGHYLKTSSRDNLLRTSSELISGFLPYTIEFTAMVSGNAGSHGYYPFLSKSNSTGTFQNQFFGLDSSLQVTMKRSTGLASSFGDPIKHNPITIRKGTFYKYLISYDGSAIRFFVNGELNAIVGTDLGLSKTDKPFELMHDEVNSAPNDRMTTLGLLKDFKVYDGVAKQVRNFDPNADKLVVDLSFDGSNNSTKITDNGSLRSTWTTHGNAKISTDQKFDGFSSLYLDGNASYLKSSIYDTYLFDGNDLTINMDIFATSYNDIKVLLSSSGSQSGFSLYASLNKIAITFLGYPSIDYVSEAMLVDNQINNVVLIVKDNTIQLYINNQLSYKDLFDYTKLVPSLEGIVLGKNETTSLETNPERYFNGYIKNFKIYKGVAIPPERVSNKYELTFNEGVVDTYGNSVWVNNSASFIKSPVRGKALSLNLNNNVYTEDPVFDFNHNNFRIKFNASKDGVSNAPSWMYSSSGTTLDIYQRGVGDTTDNTYKIGILQRSTSKGISSTIPLHRNSIYSWDIIKFKNMMIMKINDVPITISPEDFMTSNFSQIGSTISLNGTESANRIIGTLDYFSVEKESVRDKLNVYSTVGDYYTYLTPSSLMLTCPQNNTTLVKFKDGPKVKNFKAKYRIKNINGTDQILFRTTHWSTVYNTFGYVVEILDTHLNIGRGSNSDVNALVWIATGLSKPSFSSFEDRTYNVTIICNEDSIKVYIDDLLCADVVDSTFNIPGDIGYRKFGAAAGLNITELQSMEVYDLNDNLIHSEKFETKFEEVIDLPSCHLPLETHVVNLGYVNETATANGALTYHTISGKKCIKIEPNKNITMLKHTSFNFGEHADFYFSIEVNFISHKNWSFVLCNHNTYNTADLFDIYSDASGRLHFRRGTYNFFISPDAIPVGSFCKVEMYRKNCHMFIRIAGEEYSVGNQYIDLAFVKLTLGSSGWSPSGDALNGYLRDFKIYAGRSTENLEYDYRRVLDIDFRPTHAAYPFKDNNGKHLVTPSLNVEASFDENKHCVFLNGDVRQELWISRTNSLNLGTGDLLVEVVFKPNGKGGSWRSILSNHTAPWTCLYITTGNQIHVRWNNVSLFTSVEKVNVHEINTLRIVRENGFVTFYLNGKSIFSGNDSQNIDFGFGGNAYIGANGWDGDNGRFGGYVYSVKIFRDTADVTLLDTVIEEEPEEPTTGVGDVDLLISYEEDFDETFSKQSPTVVGTPSIDKDSLEFLKNFSNVKGVVSLDVNDSLIYDDLVKLNLNLKQPIRLCLDFYVSELTDSVLIKSNDATSTAILKINQGKLILSEKVILEEVGVNNWIKLDIIVTTVQTFVLVNKALVASLLTSEIDLDFNKGGTTIGQNFKGAFSNIFVTDFFTTMTETKGTADLSFPGTFSSNIVGLGRRDNLKLFPSVSQHTQGDINYSLVESGVELTGLKCSENNLTLFKLFIDSSLVPNTVTIFEHVTTDCLSSVQISNIPADATKLRLTLKTTVSGVLQETVTEVSKVSLLDSWLDCSFIQTPEKISFVVQDLAQVFADQLNTMSPSSVTLRFPLVGLKIYDFLYYSYLSSLRADSKRNLVLLNSRRLLDIRFETEVDSCYLIRDFSRNHYLTYSENILESSILPGDDKPFLNLESGDFVKVLGDTSVLTFEDNFHICMGLKFKPNGTGEMVLVSSNHLDINDRFVISYNPLSASLTVKNKGETVLSTSLGIIPNDWNTVLFSKTPSEPFKFIINNEAERESGTNVNRNLDLRGCTIGESFEGSIERVLIVEGETLQEFIRTFNLKAEDTVIAIKNPPIVVYYDSSLNSLKDSFGKEWRPNPTSSVVKHTELTVGRTGLYFNGSAGLSSNARVNSIGLSEFSLYFTLKCEELTSTMCVFSMMYWNNSNPSLVVTVNTNGSMSVKSSLFNNNSVISTDAGVILKGEVVKVCITRDSSNTLRIYKDGTKITEGLFDVNINPNFDANNNTSGVITLGHSQSSSFYKGIIADVYFTTVCHNIEDTYVVEDLTTKDLELKTKSLLGFSNNSSEILTFTDEYNSMLVWENREGVLVPFGNALPNIYRSHSLRFQSVTGGLISGTDDDTFKLDTNDFTIDLIVTPSNISADSVLLDMQESSSSVVGLRVQQPTSNLSGLSVEIGYEGNVTSTADVVINLPVNTLVVGKPIHLRLTRNMEYFSVYLDGVKTETRNIGLSRIKTSNSVILCNNKSFNKGFNGYLTQFRLLNNAATNFQTFPQITQEIT